MVPPAIPATSSLSLSVSSLEGINYKNGDVYNETSRPRRGASTPVIVIINIIIKVIIVRTAGTTVLGSLGIIFVWD